MRHFLDFEKPIAELEGQIEALRHLSNGGDLNIADEVARLETKANRQLRQTYAKLSAWQKVQVARHPERPHSGDYVAALITDFTPLAGDRSFAEDRAIVGGIGRFRGRSVVVIGRWSIRRAPIPASMPRRAARPRRSPARSRRACGYACRSSPPSSAKAVRGAPSRSPPGMPC